MASISNTATGEVVLYETTDRQVALEVRSDGETVWLRRQQMAQLFGRDVKTIGKHIANALREELAGLATVAKFATVQTEGGRVIKNHPFADGNKRSGAFLFLWYLHLDQHF